MIYESILDSNNDEDLINKYLLTISRNLLFHLRKKGIAKKHSNTIKKSTLIKFLKLIGYKNHSLKYINKLLNQFQLSSYIKSYNRDFITIKPKYDYENSDTIYLSYEIKDIKKFTFNIFKKEVIEFLYTRPNIKSFQKLNKYGSFINFTSQQKISKTLNISQSVVSQQTKGIDKIYSFKRLTEYNELKSWEDAKQKLKYFNTIKRGRYSIVSHYHEKKTIQQFYIIRLEGSRLVKIDDKIYFKYKNNKQYSSLRGELKLNVSAKYKYQVISDISKNKQIVTLSSGKEKTYICKGQLREGTSINYDKFGNSNNLNDYFYLYANNLSLEKSNIHLMDHYENNKRDIEGRRIKSDKYRLKVYLSKKTNTQNVIISKSNNKFRQSFINRRQRYSILL